MNALKVFSSMIKCLADHFKTESKKQDILKDTEIGWVITVPAIWNEKAKQFMQAAAIEVGIVNCNVTFNGQASECHLTFVKGELHII